MVLGDSRRRMRYLGAMQPSQWEWPWKLLALVLFGLAVGAVWWFANQLFREWLPTAAVVIITPAIGTFFIGVLVGQWSMARKHRDERTTHRR